MPQPLVTATRKPEPIPDGEYGIGKRRTRTPTSLSQDYYLGRSSKLRHVSRLLSSEFGRSCTYPNYTCQAKLKTEEGLKLHLKSHLEPEDIELMKDKSKKFFCTECFEKFLTWRKCQFHYWKNHGIDADLYQCKECDFKSEQLYKVAEHSLIHGEDRPYPCVTCGKAFKQIHQLRNHKVIHLDKSTSPSDAWYTEKECGICNRKFANVKCLKKHIETTHTGIKPYKCKFCGHAAARKAMLQVHMRKHTGEKPFKCDMCLFTTSDHNSLRRHRMRHTGQKPYKCPHCDYSSIQSISFKQHMKSKHPGREGVYCCDLCPFKSIKKINLDNHLNDHRNGLVGPSKRAQENADKGEGEIAAQNTHEAIDTQNSVATLVETSVGDDMATAQLIYSALNAIKTGPGGLQVQQANLDMDSVEKSQLEPGSQTFTFYMPVEGAEDTVFLTQPPDMTTAGSPLTYQTVTSDNYEIDKTDIQEGSILANGSVLIQVQGEDGTVRQVITEDGLIREVVQEDVYVIDQ